MAMIFGSGITRNAANRRPKRRLFSPRQTKAGPEGPAVDKRD